MKSGHLWLVSRRAGIRLADGQVESLGCNLGIESWLVSLSKSVDIVGLGICWPRVNSQGGVGCMRSIICWAQSSGKLMVVRKRGIGWRSQPEEEGNDTNCRRMWAQVIDIVSSMPSNLLTQVVFTGRCNGSYKWFKGCERSTSNIWPCVAGVMAHVQGSACIDTLDTQWTWNRNSILCHPCRYLSYSIISFSKELDYSGTTLNHSWGITYKSGHCTVESVMIFELLWKICWNDYSKEEF